MARPVVVGGVVEEVDEEDDLDAEVDEEVLDADEEDEEDEGGEPELSCLINSAARSDFLVSSRSSDLSESEMTHETIKHRHQMRRYLEGQNRAIHHPQSRHSIHPVP
jgi:hypothetical protein